MRITTLAAMLVAVALASSARAQEAGAPGAPHADSAQGARTTDGHANGAGASDEEADDEPVGAPPLPELKLTDTQSSFRKALIAQRQKAVAEVVGAQPATAAQRQEIGLHWRHVLRLLRIRELAEQDKNDAAVKRVDQLLTRAQAKFSSKMAKIGGAK